MIDITSFTTRANPGEQVTISCSATGLAANTFVYGWLLNGVPVRRERRQSIVVTASENTAGDYQCTVRNVYGGFTKSSVITLILSEFLFLLFVSLLYCLFPKIDSATHQQLLILDLVSLGTKHLLVLLWRCHALDLD